MAQMSECNAHSPVVEIDCDDLTLQIAARLPKVQLHIHLDGSLPENFIAERSKQLRIPLPCGPSELRRYLLTEKRRAQEANAYSQAPAGNWSVFTFCNRFLQTAEDLHSGAAAITHQLLTHNTRVVELRFCPVLHTHNGLSLDAAVSAVISGLSSVLSNQTAVNAVGGVILAALRSYPPSHVLDMIQLASRWMNSGVIAVDVAGDEDTYPLSLHAHMLRTARDYGVPLTVHAGEWGRSAQDNLQLALDLDVQRIGHALTLASDDKLCKRIADSKIPVETCLTANCSGARKIPANQFSLHPLPKLIAAGVQIAGFNCDNTLLSGTLENRPDPTREIFHARRSCKLTWRQIVQVLVTGARSTFVRFDGDISRRNFIESFAGEAEAVLQELVPNYL